MQTPHYVQVVGFINQVDIDMMEGDYGGEMVRPCGCLAFRHTGTDEQSHHAQDPHGQ